jgi:hypothetical protein
VLSWVVARCAVCHALQEQTRRLEARLLKQQQQQQTMQQSIADLQQQLSASEVGSEMCGANVPVCHTAHAGGQDERTTLETRNQQLMRVRVRLFVVCGEFDLDASLNAFVTG